MRFTPTIFAILLLACFSIGAEPATKPASVLQRKVAELKFDHLALADVVGFLGDATGATVTADWNALRKEKIDVTTSVTMHARGQTLGQVLDALLLQLNAEKKLTYTVDKDDTIEITTKAAAAE